MPIYPWHRLLVQSSFIPPMLILTTYWIVRTFILCYTNGQQGNLDIEELGVLLSNIVMSSPESFSLCAVNPDRCESSHELQRCSTNKYYIYTDSQRHFQRERRRIGQLGMMNAFLNIPSAKTSTL
ncbi:MAG: hypothetical protein EXX96DRAFT_607906 [Benjaminiella poitrasii]|nr:MAG: hypothetical protein EXX96DRAFT_607906 [Benjaminiella poitrasii]